MSGYIINPMWFYLVDVLVGLDIVCFVLATLVGFGGLLFGGFFYADNFLYDEEKSRLMKWAKRWVVLTSILIILTILIPSKETMIQMQLAKFGTYENAGKAIEAIQDATDYILEHLKGE